MTTFALTPAAVQAIATLAHAAGTKEKAAPILSAIELTVTPSRWEAVATDRYVVGKLGGELGVTAHTLTETGVKILIHAADAAALAAAVKARKSPAHVELTLTRNDEILNAEQDGLTLGEYRTMTGTFPPVVRLFPTMNDGRPADAMTSGAVAFSPDKIASLSKIKGEAAFASSRSAATRWNEAGMAFAFRGTDGRHAGTYVTRHGIPGDDFAALIQPNTLITAR